MAESIIIDGCNVAECMYFNDKNKKCRTFSYGDGVKFTSYKCEQDKNCYYKQLQKLKQENEKFRKIFKEIQEIIKILIIETPEYHSCYYKDECGDKCTPKKQGKVEYCCFENVEKIENIINEVLNEK